MHMTDEGMGTISPSTDSCLSQYDAHMGSSDKQVFGHNVRRIRESLGLTQEGLAEASELDQSYIGGVERGERNPALDSILRLATALKVAPAALFDDIGENVTSSPRSRRDGDYSYL